CVMMSFSFPLFFSFFFSSRRRHTRSKRDWSSDVCSSDLLANRSSNSVHSRWHTPRQGIIPLLVRCFIRPLSCAILYQFLNCHVRSEERRVGKECSCGWWSGEWLEERYEASQKWQHGESHL